MGDYESHGPTNDATRDALRHEAAILTRDVAQTIGDLEVAYDYEDEEDRESSIDAAWDSLDRAVAEFKIRVGNIQAGRSPDDDGDEA